MILCSHIYFRIFNASQTPIVNKINIKFTHCLAHPERINRCTSAPNITPLTRYVCNQHMWVMIWRRLSTSSPTRNEDVLWSYINSAWSTVPQHIIRTLIGSMHCTIRDYNILLMFCYVTYCNFLKTKPFSGLGYVHSLVCSKHFLNYVILFLSGSVLTAVECTRKHIPIRTYKSYISK